MLVGQQNQQLFVGINEYDAPVNSVIFSPHQDRFHRVTEFFKTQFFAVIKQATSTVVLKYWITGILPVFLDSISPLGATEILSRNTEYHGLCGLTEVEVEMIVKVYLSSLGQPAVNDVMKMLRNWCNGYLFSCPKPGARRDVLYNA